MTLQALQSANSSASKFHLEQDAPLGSSRSCCKIGTSRRRIVIWCTRACRRLKIAGLTSLWL